VALGHGPHRQASLTRGTGTWPIPTGQPDMRHWDMAQTDRPD